MDKDVRKTELEEKFKSLFNNLKIGNEKEKSRYES